MNVLMRPSGGQAEFEAALQEAEAEIRRTQSEAATASRLRSLSRQRLSRPLQLLVQASRQTNVEVQCVPGLILDRFEVGDYRLRPHHYAPLLDFVVRVAIAAG